MDVGTLKRVNRLKTDHIEGGKKLSLEGYVRKAPQQSSKKYHRVQKGNTLSKFRKK